MLIVTFYRDSRNRPSSISARGHVEYAIETDDMICAAASAILQAVRLGLERYVNIAVDAKQKPFRLSWPDAMRDNEAVRAIIATAELSIEQLARQYPEHISVSRKLQSARGRNLISSDG